MENLSQLTIVATAITMPGQEDKVREAQTRLVAATLKEKGCIRYELHQSIDDPSILTFVETWASEADWIAHMQGEGVREFQAGGAGRLIADFSLYKMKKVAG